MQPARLTEARRACEEAFQTEAMRDLLSDFAGPQGRRRAFDLLGRAAALRHAEPEVLAQWAAIPEPGRAQGLLLAASLHAIEQMPGLPVSDTVKDLFADEFLFYAAPPPQWRERFRLADVRFQEMARIATLQRFPAGQYHWEIAAFPRSWLPRVEQKWTAMRQAFLPMRGFGPVFELHVNDRRKNRVMMSEYETNLSCYRAARSLALQPRMKAIMTASWLYGESTGAVTPHLAWMRRLFREAGAAIVDLGEAPADSGFLIGSAERRKLYEEGRYRPKMSCVLWPRERVLRWAAEHPEFDR
ncbi:MAG TPA: hypothetical protein VGS58_00250 [Candidatus Sulfopaludibacter sp.]|nr:hypothetical protein [Candidatus Sulfopaludibacter sp.]